MDNSRSHLFDLFKNYLTHQSSITRAHLGLLCGSPKLTPCSSVLEFIETQTDMAMLCKRPNSKYLRLCRSYGNFSPLQYGSNHRYIMSACDCDPIKLSLQRQSEVGPLIVVCRCLPCGTSMEVFTHSTNSY